MRRTDVAVIGGGQAGLAMSHCLGRAGIDHVVLERGRIAERWHSERWDSLRLLTPNWMSRLPGRAYDGPDPDGFMSAADVAAFLGDYADSFSAPVELDTTLLSLDRAGGLYRLATDRGTWTARAVVIATGGCDTPAIPTMAAGLPARIRQIAPSGYRNPDGLPEGGVLIVGASASGVQLAEEIRRSGRAVTIAVGRHTRVPRLYRGKDIMWWLDRIGALDERIEEVPDPVAARNQPSLQLAGRPDRRTIGIPELREQGVRVVGRARTMDGARLHLADDLSLTTAAADRRLARLLARIDDHVDRAGLAAEVGERDVPRPVAAMPSPTALDLHAERISTVIWATGFARRYPWLTLPVIDGRGEIVHRGGVTPLPGLYVLGLPFLRRRKSTFIDGVGRDAEELSVHIAARFARPVRLAA